MRVTIEGAIYTKIDEYDNQRKWQFTTWGSCGEGYTKVCDHTIDLEVTMTEDQMVLAEVEAYRKAIQNVRTAAQEKVNEFEYRISTLLAIGYTPTPAIPVPVMVQPVEEQDDDFPF